jgi:hypothetical protein
MHLQRDLRGRPGTRDSRISRFKFKFSTQESITEWRQSHRHSPDLSIPFILTSSPRNKIAQMSKSDGKSGRTIPEKRKSSADCDASRLPKKHATEQSTEGSPAGQRSNPVKRIDKKPVGTPT